MKQKLAILIFFIKPVSSFSQTLVIRSYDCVFTVLYARGPTAIQIVCSDLSTFLHLIFRCLLIKITVLLNDILLNILIFGVFFYSVECFILFFCLANYFCV